MKKVVIGVVVLIVFALVGWRVFVVNSSRESDDDTLLIGAILPLTGNISDTGKEVYNGLALAIEQINKRGGKKIKMITEDGKNTVKNALSALHKIMPQNVDVLVIAGQIPVAGLAPVLNDYKDRPIPVIATMAMGNNLTSLNDFIFRFWVPISQISENVARYAKNDLNVDKMAVFAVKGEYGDDSLESFRSVFEQEEHKIIIVERYELGEKNTRSPIAKIMAAKPQAIFVTGFGPGFTSAINQLKEAGFSGYILTDTSINAPAYNANIKDMSGVLFADVVFDPHAPTPKAEKFVRDYESAFGEIPSFYAAFNYDSILLLADIIQKYDTTEPEVILNHLRHDVKNYPTLMGNVSFDERRELYLPIVIKQMQKDGVVKIVKE
ncbi:MAG: ABC transporter substrate-binding protein [Lactobacillales bacterium]|nr:ABC transporter substrate-binding protein [Lactobacillales bacterium]